MEKTRRCTCGNFLNETRITRCLPAGVEVKSALLCYFCQNITITVSVAGQQDLEVTSDGSEGLDVVIAQKLEDRKHGAIA